MVAMSLDRLLPEWMSKVDERFHTPVNAHIAYFLASIPVIFLYNRTAGQRHCAARPSSCTPARSSP
jgi:amino acid transporter